MQLKYLNIVAIGGGHGLGKVLNTFVDLGGNLTGIVATTDNGGSTGKLRENNDTIAWGDLRNCIAHLAQSQLGSKLLNYRFDGGELDKHCLGNLIFFALEQLDVKPVEIMEIVRRLLKIESKLYPMTERPTDLVGHFGEQQIHGETAIDSQSCLPDALSLTDTVTAPSRALRAIYNANVILLGPGSFLTSVMPALLVDDIYQAITKSNAQVIFIDNLGVEHGACQHTSLQERLTWLQKCRPELVINGVLSGLTTSQVSLSQSVACAHAQAELSDCEVTYRHDEKKLRQALTELISSICHPR
ncbi:hypothetical protein DS2_05595 [Catenovulum agarivorans DS-2]|uniref:Gluconeogenesis factor n=1 Tax=Catenovulum agarivorans DS-2 TaxID=1328313 RepID=W7QPV5_9ALTE|nr:uridine diphosphate-N-acetylglucosamine-binding protein YvcK [Catenovulum agarivorans]EWH11017.1 hypothetical protein DS2_05595 [Catenovulum agarivorans DS-2]